MSGPPISVAEQHVQLAARHFIRRGDVVYDVGANRGWLTTSFWKLVGSAGQVSCFEASPRNIQILEALVSSNAMSSTEVVGAAVYTESGIEVQLFENSFSNTDSIYFADDQAKSIRVPTISLDDYLFCTRRPPRLVKMDIEGAEYDALLGAETLVEQHRPVFLMEMRKEDVRPYEFLTARSYRAYNLKTFDLVRKASDFEGGGMVEDILFVHETELDRSENSFLRAANDQAFERVDHEAVQFGKTTLCHIPVGPGISCVKVFTRGCNRTGLSCSVLAGGRCIVRSDADYYLICEPNFSFTLYSSAASTATLCMQVLNDDPLIEIVGVEVKTIALDAGASRHLDVLDIIDPFGAPVAETFPILDECINQNRADLFDRLADPIVKVEPNNPRLTYLSGMSAAAQGKLEEAASLLDRSLSLGFDAFWGQFRRAHVLKALGRRAEAREAALAAQRASPHNPDNNALLDSLAES
ncbi:FkbM family methyltransferase [Methylobacterium radiotolerans]|uniref:FkbM family methyltransferase n=1 Tax=Methylobacterium radiotolerans TaxID=31998 RepID=UPI0015F77F5D|nr:FkbM family methyltransferase [Methylobacterium radiotolerans]